MNFISFSAVDAGGNSEQYVELFRKAVQQYNGGKVPTIVVYDSFFMKMPEVPKDIKIVVISKRNSAEFIGDKNYRTDRWIVKAYDFATAMAACRDDKEVYVQALVSLDNQNKGHKSYKNITVYVRFQHNFIRSYADDVVEMGHTVNLAKMKVEHCGKDLDVILLESIETK